MSIFKLPSPLTEIKDIRLKARHIRLFIKRDDLIHSEVSGNKWRKLKFNLVNATDNKYRTLLTFGGAYSNHLLAVASAADYFKLKSIGAVRGDELNAQSNPTLKRCHELGMKIIFISRKDYKKKEEERTITFFQDKFPEAYLIPEGGHNQWGAKGCEEIINEIKIPYDYIITAVGTGTTLAGLINKAAKNKQLLGIPVLKGENYLEGMIDELIQVKKNSWQLIHDYHFGGYGKFNDLLIQFINRYKTEHGIQLDPIYTGKALFGVYDLIEQGFFPSESKIIYVHTGGVFGIKGFNERYGALIR